jgi:hypothetical protein
LKPISEVTENDYVITRGGIYSRVQKTWFKDFTGNVYKISFSGNPGGVTLTGNHKVWTRRDEQWMWVPAEQLNVGDIIGEPVVTYSNSTPVLSFHEKFGNGLRKTRIIKWSTDACRFLGYFLADGHTGSRNGIWIDFGPDEQSYADDVRKIVLKLFNRSVSFCKHGKSIRCEFSHKSLHTWLQNHCYDIVNGDKVKRFPLKIEELNLSSIHGLVIGLVRGDGWAGNYASGSIVNFGNSSKSLITAFHLMIGRMGLTSTLTVRKPRGTTWGDGRRVLTDHCKPEWVVHVTGHHGEYLRQLITNFDKGSIHQKVWMDCGLRCTKIRKIEVMEYTGKVHDVTIDGDSSFSAPYITMHNSGMTNVCLAYNAMSALEFSLARGGDWVDRGAARAVGATSAKMCVIKENGINMFAPKNREEEAVTLYLQALIDYSIDSIIAHFEKVRKDILVPKPVPIIISGGTSLTDGFVKKFEECFGAYRGKFPIEISEIRAAKDPMTAVAHGLLLYAQMDED